MNCPACGNPNRAGVKFCAKCGKPLSQQSAVAQPPQTPAYQPPPAPPSPVQVPPLMPAAQAAAPSRKMPVKTILIGCGAYLLGMICGALVLAGVVYGPDLLKGGTAPAPSAPAMQTPLPVQSPPRRNPGPVDTPKPLVRIEPSIFAPISSEMSRVPCSDSLVGISDNHL